MIKVTIYRKSGAIVGFRMTGHAGYGPSGADIVCAAVSALAINAVNSIEALTEDRVEVEADGGGGRMLCRVREPGEQSRLLLESLVLGLQGIRKEYQGKYIRLTDKEV